MRASYGTTKYCMAFLRGVQCSDHSCMNLHEWGDEKDCFTKEDLTTLYLLFHSPFNTKADQQPFSKHTMKATESRTRTVTTKKADEDGAYCSLFMDEQMVYSLYSRFTACGILGSKGFHACHFFSWIEHEFEYKFKCPPYYRNDDPAPNSADCTNSLN